MSVHEPTQFNIHEAKTHLSRLVERALSGEEIIISRAGKPAVKLVQVQDTFTPRQPGLWKGQVVIADDFDELPPDILAAFEGEAE